MIADGLPSVQYSESDQRLAAEFISPLPLRPPVKSDAGLVAARSAWTSVSNSVFRVDVRKKSGTENGAAWAEMVGVVRFELTTSTSRT